MAEFLPAFEKMIENEGGYQVHEQQGDRGGLTFAGIARNFHPDWEGWSLIDEGAGTEDLKPFVQDFYRNQFWERIRGDFIDSQKIAETIFDFAVNAGVSTASRLAQEISGAYVDGIIGTRTVNALNDTAPISFLHSYALKKIARYAEIVNQNPSQSRFLLGWINRTLKSIS